MWLASPPRLTGLTAWFVVSDDLRLEILPKPGFHRNRAEVAFCTAFYGAVAEWVTPSPALTARAIALATRYDLTR